MYVVLATLGIATAAVGLAALGYGIPNIEFSLGGTYIQAGATTFVGGLIVFGLALALRELRRIAASSSARPPARVGRGEPPEPIAPVGVRPGAATGRSPMPSLKPGGDGPGRAPPRPFEPRLAGASSTETSPDHVERPLPRIAPIVQVEPLLVDEAEEVTLSPRTPRSVPFSPTRPETEDAGREPKIATEPAARRNGAEESQRSAAPRADIGWRPAPVRPVVERKLSTMMWGPKPRRVPIAPADPELDEAPSPLAEDAPPSAAEPHVVQGSFAAKGAGDVRPVSILKSGVVDGMAYTLYNDGSIEAELPEGTMRFASLGGLREHLEKYS